MLMLVHHFSGSSPFGDTTLTDDVTRGQTFIQLCKSLQFLAGSSTKSQADLRKTFATSFLDR
ncbi:hypothetical protein [Lentzea fradiae]|uniref:hypothetical protein n=1 Tax=Lentzea fradiae TaxID=200378 RepID=UPI00115FCD44|nr:hypothetical protein [Lentzea fradiae]